MGAVPHSVAWIDGALRLLDQRRIPQAVVWCRCTTVAETVAAIQAMVVRGAPAIGLAGGYGVVLAVREARGDLQRLQSLTAALAGARPTAVNLRGAVEAVRQAATAAATDGLPEMEAAALAAARALQAEQAAVCARIAQAGTALLEPGASVLTHCHTGALATGVGDGTALGAIVRAAALGRLRMVFVDETRPLGQGARLTAWELGQHGIPCRVIVDGAAGSVLARGLCQAVWVGADRIARNGDVANKIGTYPLAVLAARHGVPFIVFAPRSSIDTNLPTGADIPLEYRAPDEIFAPYGAAWAEGWNPAFDVTPAELVRAVVTEDGVYRYPYDFRAGWVPEPAQSAPRTGEQVSPCSI